MGPFKHLEVGRIQKLTNDRSKFNFTIRYLHWSDKGSNQITYAADAIIVVYMHKFKAPYCRYIEG